jgi:hypothetical protein
LTASTELAESCPAATLVTCRGEAAVPTDTTPPGVPPANV